MEDNTSSVIHAQAYRNYYRTHFRKYQTLNPEDSLDHYERSFSPVLPRNPAARILEIGSGLGKFAYFLKKAGYTDVTCVDISEELAELAKQYSGVDVIVVAEPIDFLRAQGENAYDAVFMLDVIEHIRKENIIEYLRLVRRVIKPSGTLHLTTENMSSPVGGRIQHYLDFTHEYNYSEISLKQVLEIAGFSNISMRSVTSKISGIRSLLYWLAREILFLIYRLIYEIERPGMIKPKNFSKDLIVLARK